MSGLAPRATVAAPFPLLQHLRLRACCAAFVTSIARSERSSRGCGNRNAVPPRVHAQAATAAVAAAVPEVAARLQSSSGVDPKSLIGFTAVDLTNNSAVIGEVEDVLAQSETGRAQPLLHIRALAEPAQPADAPREEHLIPFVPQIVPNFDRATGTVYIQPPAGLLDLGREHLLLANLRRDLAPFTTPEPLSVLSRMGVRIMPSTAQLLAAGRKDLVAAIKRAGGFLGVAQMLGLRSQRKPAGFWDDEANLEEELTLFVAAHWTRFQDPDTRQHYWYNQITHRISWEEPVLPERVAVDDEGGYICTEAEEDRVMPSRKAVFAAGRYDLHHAILHHGGYIAASKQLDRRPAWPPSQHLRSLPELRQELREFLKETGLSRNRMPTASQLLNAGRGDLYQAISRRGGFAAAADALGWDTQRRREGSWPDAAAVATELRQFILDSQFTRGEGRQQGRSSSSSRAQAQQEQQQQVADLAPLPPGSRMPTHVQLASAGRHDIKYGLQQHGSGTVAALLGIQLDRRGAHNRRIPAAAGQRDSGEGHTPLESGGV